MHKWSFFVWLSLLQPSRYLQAIGASDDLRKKLQGVGPLVAPSFDGPAIVELLDKYVNVFVDPIFPPSDYVTDDILYR